MIVSDGAAIATTAGTRENGKNRWGGGLQRVEEGRHRAFDAHTKWLGNTGG